MTYPSEAEANEFNGSARLVVGLLFLVSLAVGGYAVHLNALLSNRLGMAVMVMQSQDRRIADLERTGGER